MSRTRTAAALLVALACAPAAPAQLPDAVKLEALKGHLQRLKSGPPAERRKVLAELVEMGPDGVEAAPAVVQAVFYDPDAGVRAAAEAAAGRFGERAAGELGGFLRHERVDFRYKAAVLLQRLGREAGPAADQLAAALVDADKGVRVQAAKALARVGPAAARAVDGLLAAAADPDSLVRAESLAALGGTGDTSGEALRVARKGMADKEGYVRRNAAYAVGRLAGADPKALEYARELAKSSEVFVRAAVAKGLGESGSGKAVLPLVVMLRDADTSVQKEAAYGLGKFGPEARSAAGDLGALARTRAPADKESADVARAALSALGDIGPAAKAAVADVGSVVGVTDDELSVAATQLLAKMGPAARPAAGDLVNGLKSKQWVRRKECALALGAVKADDPASVKALEGALGDGEWTVREAACVALGKLGPAARSALPALKSVAEADSSEYVRGIAAQAVSAVGARR